MEARDYVRVLQRRWPVILVSVALGLLIGLVTSATADTDQPTEYEATHTLIVDLSDPEGVPPANLAQTELLVTEGEVPARVAERPEFADLSANEVEGSVVAEHDAERQALDITASSRNAGRAEALADAFAEELLVELTTQQDALDTAEQEAVRQDLEDVQARIDELDREIGGAFAEGGAADDTLVAERDALVNQYRLAYEQFSAEAAEPDFRLALRTLDRADAQRADQGVSAPESTQGRMAFFGFLGLLLGGVLVLVLDRLDHRIQNKEQAEEQFGLPVLAEVPTLPRRYRGEILPLTRPESPIVEAYRELRSLLLLERATLRQQSTNGGDAPPDNGNRLSRDAFVVVVSSPAAVEGKTTTVANLAAVFAELGASVLVIDCDFRQPRLHEMFGGSRGDGLARSLATGAALESPTRLMHETDIPHVSIVPSGPPAQSPAELAPLATGFIEAARNLADVIIIDTPPLLVATDATECMRAADTAVIVARVGRTTHHEAARASELLQRHRARVYGVVLAGSTEAAVQYGGYHYRTQPPEGRGIRGVFSRRRFGPPAGGENGGRVPEGDDADEVRFR